MFAIPPQDRLDAVTEETISSWLADYAEHPDYDLKVPARNIRLLLNSERHRRRLGLKFDRNGRLTDGLHRLLAVALSGVVPPA